MSCLCLVTVYVPRVLLEPQYVSEMVVSDIHLEFSTVLREHQKPGIRDQGLRTRLSATLSDSKASTA